MDKLRESESLRERAVAHAFAHARACEARMDAAEARAAELQGSLDAVLSSSAWRLTWPVRRIGARYPGLTSRAARLLRAARRRQPEAAAESHAAEADGPAPLALPVDLDARPLVSVVITSYGKVPTTLDCLASIAANRPRAPIEVVVIDDASGDPDLARIAAVPGVRLIDTGANAGYGPACNQGAAAARGDYVLLLNNDTLVLPGWLDSMLDLMRDDATAGAVGSKLLYPDGRLQEAGGIIWSDATGWNFGRGDEPDAPAYNYVRETDYCSAACLLVRRDVFLGMGGFDPRYAPAYFEDSDLAFRLRARGLRVLYQPRSEVVHLEGASHGTDVASGGKAYQLRNQPIFAAAWDAVLRAEHHASGRHVLRARDRAGDRRIVLLADHYVPEPDRDAGSVSMVAIMRALRESGCVVKLLPGSNRKDPRYVDPLQDAGIEVLEGIDHGGFGAWIARHGEDLDNVILSRPDVAAQVYGGARMLTSAPIAYYTHDLHFARMRRQAELLRQPEMEAAADAMEALERRIWRNVDVVLSVSEDETQAVRALEPGADCRTILAYAFDDFGAARPPPRGADMLFVAGFGHPPNEDAAVWFASAILPLVLARVPGARLRIVGSNPTKTVRALAGPRVEVAADVSDAELEAAYVGARVAVVPLRFGAGVKLKVVDALRRGVPLVTTPTGAQGLAGVADAARVADSPDGFAAMVCDLLTDDAAWSDCSLRQAAYAKARFSREAYRRSLLSALGIDPLNPGRAAAGRR